MRVLILALFVALVLAGDPCANPTNAVRGRPVLSLSKTPEHAKRLARAQQILTKKRTNVQMMMMRRISDDDSGGGYVTSVNQLPFRYNSAIGIGPNSNNNIFPNFYTVADDKTAMSCQLDCMSIYNGKTIYSSCSKRFYKYGSLADTQGCFSTATPDQAALVNQICTQINGCSGARIQFTPANLAQVRGSNTFYKP